MPSRDLMYLAYEPKTTETKKTDKPFYVAVELFSFSKYLKRNWEVFAEQIQKARDSKKEPLSDLEARTLQDMLVLIRQEGGALKFQSPDNIRVYMETLYSLMGKAKLKTPRVISFPKQYVTGLDALNEKNVCQKEGYTISVRNIPLNVKNIYKPALQVWLPAIWVGFISAVIGGGLAVILTLSLVKAGWMLPLVLLAALCVAVFGFNEKYVISGTRSENWSESLARRLSGLYSGLKVFSFKNAVISALVLIAVGLVLFAPGVGLIASGMAAFGLAMIAFIYLLSHSFHNGGSTLDTAKKTLEKWTGGAWRFGFSEPTDEAKFDADKMGFPSKIQSPNTAIVANHIKDICESATDEVVGNVDRKFLVQLPKSEKQPLVLVQEPPAYTKTEVNKPDLAASKGKETTAAPPPYAKAECQKPWDKAAFASLFSQSETKKPQEYLLSRTKETISIQYGQELDFSPTTVQDKKESQVAGQNQPQKKLAYSAH